MDWSFVHKTSSPYYPKENSYAEQAVVKEVHSKCKDDCLLGLLVHRFTPFLYSGNAKSPAEIFLGQKIATNILHILFGTAALMHSLRNNNNDHDHERRFDPQARDSCYTRLNPMENVWEKGFIVRKVIGVPDSCGGGRWS